MLSPPPVPVADSDIPPLGMTFGAVYIGATIGAIFYGITIVQTVIYYKQYPNDPRLFRYAIALLCILDTLHVVTSTHVLYFYLVESFGNWLSLFRTVWSFLLQILLNTLIIVGVQALYAVRIWKFGRNFHVVLPWFIFLAVAASLTAGIYVIYDTYTLPSLFDRPTMRTSVYAVFSTFVGADFFIATTMCYYLHKGRSATSFSSTTKIIMGLMRLVVMSGLATSASSLFALVADIVWPNSFICIAVDSILPKLYITSLLSMLNARNVQMRTGTKEHPVHQTILRFAPHTSGSSGPSDSAERSIDIALSVMERGHSNTCPEDMTFT
ncbi:uncharacterized protein EV420DRAFT_971016 [Desarmillaria tabescens]|uniref:DUF6534 domain-containing protein n=1 Tax=Armillaria tabescens TaxID=1929756 RepID=A0AA39JP64_ARMTA|nr:uncharacterized protein EV420DRAFT_971016 [Desarmillaria tabescens]KAK0445301.1 hypothetical protein EV420DRAFT_971016 [Desarmillaria tabescens]